MKPKIAILGDFNTAYSTHHALNKSIGDMNAVLEEKIPFDWIGTDAFDAADIFSGKGYAGLWIAPGSPYKNDENVLRAIRHARMNNIPTLGNCGGFQYMLIEFAKNICGIEHAEHEETNPGAADPLISKLSCSLVEKEEELSITNTASALYHILKTGTFTGKYYCSYGLNSRYAASLQEHGLLFTAVAADKQVRAFELPGHPFFLGTLFQPALTSSAGAVNPIITAFVRHCTGKATVIQ